MRGKRIKTECSNPEFNLIVGCVEDAHAPKSIYLHLSTWAYQIEDEDSLSWKITRFKRKVKGDIGYYRKILFENTVFDLDHYIIDIEVGEKNYNNADKLHFEVEINLTQKNGFCLPLMKARGELFEQAKKVANRLFDLPSFTEYTGLDFRKTRKK